MAKKRLYSKKLIVRMTDQEYEVLTHRAKNSQVSLAGFIRLLILGQTVEYHQDLDRLIYEINKIGTNINQIAWQLNGTGFYDKPSFEACKEALKKILQEVENGHLEADAHEGGEGEKQSPASEECN